MVVSAFLRANHVCPNSGGMGEQGAEARRP